ncbi:DNA (cytosine-5-)-methyltransferase 3 beta, duplicate a [Engraulis encrasicolus]|uniref:DNA (cytosine-5-)-methyltransferase 3 beta, duplicate a n=1 Tax=Engraulis encrasicolus TaxID=184585 RepID=UPI002FD5E7E9
MKPGGPASGHFKMATNVSLNESFTEDRCSRADLLKWLNETLQIKFSQVEQTCSGACYCQIMHGLFPESIDLGKVKFQAKEKEDFTHNFQLLQESFTKTEVETPIPVEDIIRGRFRPTFNFLRWFKKFSEANVSKEKYNPIKARKGEGITPARPFVKFSQPSDESNSQDVTVIESDTDEEPQSKSAGSYDQEWEKTFDWIKPSSLGSNFAFCSLCDINLSLHQSGTFVLRRHQTSKIHSKKKRESSSGSKVDSSVLCSEALASFIQTLDISGSEAQNRTRLILGPRYPQDITTACKETPYCLYLYGQIALSDSQHALVALVGFFDDKAAKHRIRFLEALQNSGEGISGEAMVRFLTETLKKFDLPSKNLCSFYMDGLGECLREKVVAHLKELNPNIVALGGLYDVPDVACHVGVTEHFRDIKELLLKIQSYYTTLASTDDTLKALFTGLPDLSLSLSPQSTPCQVFATLVRRVVEMWTELSSCFSTEGSGEGNSSRGQREEICALFKPANLRVKFMFLDFALDPLRSFQNRLETRNGAARADLVQILREASGLLRAYASSFLRPQAVMRYLKEKDAAVLQNPEFHLPIAEKTFGGVSGDLEEYLFRYEVEMADYITEFQKSCLSFYITVTASLSEDLPLSDGVLRSMSQILSPEGRLKVSGKAIADLASQLGVCAADDSKLTDEFSQYQLGEEKNGKSKTGAANGTNGCGNGHRDSLSSSVMLEEHWGTYLRKTGATSVFRKLMLTLLALPCPPLEAEKVFAQAAASVKSTPTPTPSSTPMPMDDSMNSDSDVIKVDLISDESQSDSPEVTAVSTPTLSKKKKSPKKKKETATKPTVDEDIVWTSTKKGDGVRGLHGWDSSLRQKPAARTLFQAGTGTWCKPLEADDVKHKAKSEDSSLKDPESPESPATPGRNGPKASTPSASPKTPTGRTRKPKQYKDKDNGFMLGEMLWGKGKDFSWWPGMVVEWKGWSAPAHMRRVEWFGDGMFSEIHTENLLPFAAFAKCFCTNSYSGLPKYKTAIYQALELAGQRCEKSFMSPSGSKDEEMKNMLEWAFGGFQPTGPNGFLPARDEKPNEAEADLDSDSSTAEYQPPTKKGRPPGKKKVYMEPQSREHILKELSDKKKSIESFCISCGSSEPEVAHPLFEGGLCEKCKKNFTETLYRYDEDGYQSYCTVCCWGNEVILCSNASCCRCFCKDCLEFLIGPGTFDRMKEVEPWSCYICDPVENNGSLRLRPDWTKLVQEFFADSSALQFEPHRLYPPVPAHQRRPIRVLSLFDGIATGYQVLKELGLQIELYVAAEICEDAIAVGAIQHEGHIKYIMDARSITRKHLAEWGQFDLLIGASPTHDLCMANVTRKGVFEGTGRLFFEYYRMLTMLRPREDDDRPFFHLFESVVSMSNNDKTDISRFLECNPVMLDAVAVTPVHRARYFWGNLPAMNRRMVPSENDRINLQDCLEIKRIAKTAKLKNITSKVATRGKLTGLMPVTMNGEDDHLWATELEKVFGFPKHYTDVANMGRARRQQLLGKAWSVPVVRHLLSPLKDYFLCKD